jgi:hypothetical protein
VCGELKACAAVTHGRQAHKGRARCDGKKNPLAKDAPDRKVPQQEKDEVKKVLKQIERAKTLTKTFNETTLPMLRRQMAGTYKADSDETNVRTNLIFATAATLLPHIYAKNPEISVSPSESVDDSEYEMIRQLCKASQIAVNKLLVDEAKLKPRVKSGIRSTMTTSVGWFKLSFQQSLTAGDPIILRRANDAQENLRQVEWLIHSADGTTDPTELNQKREEIKQQMQGIMSGTEIKTFKGFTLDRVKTEDMFILDESITEFDEFVDAKKIAHRVWMTDDEFEATFGFKCPQSATKYGQPAATEATDEQGSKIQNGGDESGVCYRAVFEVWDKTTNLVSAVCEGSEGYCSYPHAMTASPERWYPFYALGFNILEGRWRPLSDVELLQKLQDEYNTTRYLYAEARKEAIPIRVFRKAGGLTPEDIIALSNRKARDWLGIEGSPTIGLDQEIKQLEGVKIDPQAYDVTIIRNDMDMMVGLSDASRSNLIQAKTATEAEIMKQALMTRVAERQDSVEDMVSQMALAVLQMAMEVFSKAEIEQLCGKGAGAAWPEETGREEIFRKLRVQVKAGSSGKPNLMKERESWATIMPVIQNTMTQVTEMRLQGQFDLAQSMIELLKETLQRYDEKIDVERFIPKQKLGEDGQPQQDPRDQAMQQLEQSKQQMEQMGQELQQCKDALQKCETDLAIAKHAEQARIAEAESTKAIETARETSKGNLAQQESAQQHERDIAELATKQAAELRSKAFTVAVNAAATLIAARMAPTPGAEGEPAKAGEDLTPEQIGQAIATIVSQVMTAIPITQNLSTETV